MEVAQWKAGHTGSFSGPLRNRLLAALPPSDLDRIIPHFERITIQRGAVLQDVGQRLEYAYFLESGIGSLQVQTDADRPIDAGLVGRAGLVGVPIVLGTVAAPVRIVMQIPGTALRIGSPMLKAAMGQSAALRQVLRFSIQATAVQSAQLVLCNARHDTEQRVARWLLLARDWLDSDEIAVTQEILSGNLGVRRPSITSAVTRLQEAGVVRGRRGCIMLLNRDHLETVSCRCYGIISSEYNKLFAKAPPRTGGRLLP